MREGGNCLIQKKPQERQKKTPFPQEYYSLPFMDVRGHIRRMSKFEIKN